jgi:hypothetical protein
MATMFQSPFLLPIDNEEDIFVFKAAYELKLAHDIATLERLNQEINDLKKAISNCQDKLLQVQRYQTGGYKDDNATANSKSEKANKVNAITEEKETSPSQDPPLIPIEIDHHVITTTPPMQPYAQATLLPGYNEGRYIAGKTKAAQAEYILRKVGRASSTREILESLIREEPGLLKKYNTTFDKYQKALSATLYQKAAARKTFVSNKDGDSVKYGLLKWNDRT